jgi:excisionase family DNA binding protein
VEHAGRSSSRPWLSLSPDSIAAWSRFDLTAIPNKGDIRAMNGAQDLPIGPGEAARRLGVSPRTIQRWLRDGRLPAVRIGSRLKVSPAALERMREAPGRPANHVVLPTATRGQLRIRRLLVANRGELVPRIARTSDRLGVTCVALVANDQADAWWTQAVPERVPLGTTYLDAAAILAAARSAGADAIHPGYGFLAEQPGFAEAVLETGLTWVGPPPAAMRALGDKAAARRLAARLGLPVLPGYEGAAQGDVALRREAERIGYPILLKPSAGGGGKGMHLVRDLRDLRESLGRARRESSAAFADTRLVLERYLERPRHVEVQLLCDGDGNAIHLGERDCSLQRRHQKVLEEAPAPGVGSRLRARLGEAALTLARAAGYVGAGTVEFLLDENGSFYFLELNARLQVEHPVTEAVTGLDLVEAQLRIASGERLWLRQRDVRFTGHAVEARLYAEDPWAAFLPAAGTVESVTWPNDTGLRVDRGVGAGDTIGTRYDPLLAKLIAHGPTRAEALTHLARGLDVTRTLGVTSNRGFLLALLTWPETRRGEGRTDTIELRWHPDPEPVPETAWTTAAAALAEASDPTEAHRLGFRLNGPPSLRIRIGETSREVALDRSAVDAKAWTRGADGAVVLDVDGRAFSARFADPPSVAAALHRATHAEAAGEAIRAPMPGVVLAVLVAAGDQIEAHDVLLVLEAMKMENAVAAPAEGEVARVLVRPGQAVQRGDVLVELC